MTATLTLAAFGQTVASSGSSTSPYQFGATSGYRTEGDAGLTLVGCRYYDAQVGRFITRDTYLDQAPYAYCDGDPVNCVDPSGHDTVVVGGNTFHFPHGSTVDIGTDGSVTIIPPVTIGSGGSNGGGSNGGSSNGGGKGSGGGGGASPGGGGKTTVSGGIQQTYIPGRGIATLGHLEVSHTF